jgi:hypothetical protein
MATESARDDRPRKKKKKKKSGAGLWIGLGVGGGVLLVILIATVVVVLLRPWERGGEKKNDVAQNQPPQQQPPGDIGRVDFSKKGGGNIVQNVRGSIWRTERRAELKSIGLSFNQFCDTHKGASRTYDNFLNSLRQDVAIHGAIKEGYYKVNMKAEPFSSHSIIAYERDIDATGYLSVRGDGSVDYVPLAELKNAGGIP